MYKLNEVPDVAMYKMLFLKKLEALAFIEKADAVLNLAPQEVVAQATQELEDAGKIERIEP